MARTVHLVALEVRDLVAQRMPVVHRDPVLLELLLASVENTAVGITHRLGPSVGRDRPVPPTAVIEHARRLAQRGVPAHAWVHSYALGQQPLLRWALDSSMSVDGASEVRIEAYEWIADQVFDYSDRVSQQVVETYEEESAGWLANQSRTRDASVREILDDGEIDVGAAERMIGYPVQGHHVGIVAWTCESAVHPEQLRLSTQAIQQFATEIGGRIPLVVSRDRATVWAWVPVARDWQFEQRLTEWRPNGRSSLVLALGSSQRGLEGFRRTHEEAQRAHRLAAMGGAMSERGVLSHDEPGLAATELLARDLDGARSWIRGVLGDLVRNDEPTARLRDTLLTLLRHDMSYTATADAMTMHKNSIKYRQSSAEALIGAPIARNQLDVHIALTACEWLGSRVLA